MQPQKNSNAIADINNYPKAEWTSRVGAYLLDAAAAAVVGFIIYAGKKVRKPIGNIH